MTMQIKSSMSREFLVRLIVLLDSSLRAHTSDGATGEAQLSYKTEKDILLQCYWCLAIDEQNHLNIHEMRVQVKLPL